MSAKEGDEGKGVGGGVTAGRVVLCLFDRLEDAGQAVEDLVGVGVPADAISLIARQDAGPDRAAGGTTGEPGLGDGRRPPPPQGGDGVREAGAGVLWARLDGLGITLDFLPLPGVGWAMAAGPLSAVLRSPEAGLGWGAALLGAAFGPTAAGLTGTLVHLGIPEEDARRYVEGLRSGGILILVPAESDATIDDLKAVVHYNQARGSHGREFTPRPAPPGPSATYRMDPDRARAHRTAEGVIIAPPDSSDDARPEAWAPGEPMVERFIAPVGAAADEAGNGGNGNLHEAAARGDRAEMARLLDGGADVNGRRGPLRLTPLMAAAALAGEAHRSAAAVKFLLVRGADPNALGANGAGALARAVAVGNEAAARLLLEAGADPNGSGDGDDAPPNVAPLWAAVALGRGALVRLLIAHGAYVNIGDSTYGTPFTVAVVKGDAGIARTLLDAGADPRRPSQVNLPLLAVALTLRNPPMARLLEENGLSLALADGGVTGTANDERKE